MNNGCAIHGWSPIASASADSQLAGVLAGFVFTGIILLFGRRGPKNTQALGLFCSAFVALGLDSHLFGVISGGMQDPFCVRVWSEGMTAAGLLAVGAMAVITGLSWLLASHVEATTEGEDSKPSQPSRAINLDWMVRVIAYGVGVTVTLLLASTTYDYLSIVYTARIPGFLAWSVTLSPISVATISVGIALLTRRISDNRGLNRSNIANIGLRVAAYGILSYVVAGPIFAGVISELTAGVWRHPSPFVVGAALSAGLVLPALLMVALVQAVPCLSPAEAMNHRDDDPVEPIAPQELPQIGAADQQAPSSRN